MRWLRPKIWQRTKCTFEKCTFVPLDCLKSTAVHLQFVRQYAPHLYRRTFLASKLRRKGNPAIRLPFVLQYASHLYGNTPRICTATLLKNTGGWGHRNVSDKHQAVLEQGNAKIAAHLNWWAIFKALRCIEAEEKRKNKAEKRKRKEN